MGELESYRSKRQFGRSPEPRGADGGPDSRERRFVVQKHAARRTHFDLRLEVGGTLRSWAVPKGPSADPETKRLAVQVEDHPLDYLHFEGVIPKGEYGAGSVIVWDQGRYRPLGLESETDQRIELALEDGKLEFELLGERLRGRWALVRMKGRDGDQNWLLLKKKDIYAEPGDPDGLVDRYQESVVTGRGLAEPEETVDHVAPPIDSQPMLAERSESAPEGPAWCYELKVDGIRAIVWARPDGTTRIYSRRGQRLESAFPEISDALELLARRSGTEFVLDGEIVAVRADGAPSFEDLQPRFNLRDSREIAHWSRAQPAEMVVFDLLWLDGTDLREEALSDRKSQLRSLMKHGGYGLSYHPHEVGGPTAMQERARREGWEGIVAKRLKSRYRSGERTRDWVKVKEVARQEFVVGGWTDPQGGRQGFGALLIGYHDEPGAQSLRFAGRVGSGFSDADLRTISERLRESEQSEPPFDEPPPDVRDAHWVRPELVVEVKFQEWTKDERLRQPVFLGVRTDVSPARVVREAPGGAEPLGPPVEPGPELSALIDELATLERKGGDGELLVDGRRLRVTNLAKVLWPESGFTKGDLLRYYVAVAPAILPVVADRPLTLERYPDGIDGEMFYQQRAPEPVPEGVRTATIESDGEKVERLIGGDLYTLLYTTQLAAISQHVWPSRLASLGDVDYSVLDLDPAPDVPFARVREVALAARDELQRLGVRSYAKTSGGSGIHVVIPLVAGMSYETARLLAELAARLVARVRPEITTLQRSVEKRGTRVYLDYLQNRRGKTVASAYSVRPRRAAPVSAPLRWSELEDDFEPEAFNLRTMPDRIAQVGDLWAACRSDANDIREVLELL